MEVVHLNRKPLAARWCSRRLPLMLNKVKSETSASLGVGSEEVEVYAGPDRWDLDRGGRGSAGWGGGPQARHQHADVLPVEEQVRWGGGKRVEADAGAGGAERSAEADVRGPGAEERGDQGCSELKIVTPAARQAAVELMTTEHRLSKVRACRIAGLSRSVLYRPVVDRKALDAAVIDALNAIVLRLPRQGAQRQPVQQPVRGPSSSRQLDRRLQPLPMS